MSIYGIIFKKGGADAMKKKTDKFSDDYHLDEVGRIVIPKPVRKRLGIVSEVTPLDIYTESDKIIIKVLNPGCVFCESNEDTIELKGKRICLECLDKLNKIKEINF